MKEINYTCMAVCAQIIFISGLFGIWTTLFQVLRYEDAEQMIYKSEGLLINGKFGHFYVNLNWRAHEIGKIIKDTDNAEQCLSMATMLQILPYIKCLELEFYHLRIMRLCQCLSSWTTCTNSQTMGFYCFLFSF